MAVEDSGPFVEIALAFAGEAVADKRGKVHCKWVRLAAKRFLADIRRAKRRDCPFYFSAWHADDVCDFIEKLPHVQGSWDDPTLVLEPAQIFILANVFGFRRKSDDRRRYTRAYIEMARKNAKSTLTAGIALYCLTCEGEMGPDIVVGATTGAQAEKVFKPAKLMVEKTGALREAFALRPWARSITCADNGGSIQPINSKSSTQDGWNPYVGILDELHAHKDRGLFDVIRSAFGARKQPLMWMITTAGYDVRGVCFEQRAFLVKVLEGAFPADHYFGIIFTIDEARDCEVTGAEAIAEVEGSCLCNTVSPIQIEKFWQEACARHAIKPGIGRNRETSAKAAALAQDIEEAFALRATKNGSTSGPEWSKADANIQNAGEKGTPTAQSEPKRSGAQPTPDAPCESGGGKITGSSRKNTTRCFPNAKVSAQYASVRKRLYASIIATLPDEFEDFSASSVTAQSAFSATLSKALEGHCDTCPASQMVQTDHVLRVRLDGDDPFAEPNWRKANPLLGSAVDLDELRGYAIEAKESPASLGEFLTKRLNVWLNAASAWLSGEQWKKAAVETLDWSDFKGCECAVGADLADKDDITAVVLVGMAEDGRLLFKPVFFLPAAALVRETQSDTGQSTYGVWAGHNGGPPLDDDEVGLPPLFELKPDGAPDWSRPLPELPPAWRAPLLVTPGDFVDHNTVEQLVRWFVATQSVRKIIFDQFAAAQSMASRLNEDLGTPDDPIAAVLHKSAANVTNPAKELEARVRAKDPSKHLAHDGNPVLSWMISNAVVTRHVNGTIIPKKESTDSQNKIDGVDAMINGIAHFVAVEAEAGPAPVEFTGL